MNMRDLIPWARASNRPSEIYRDEASNPFLALQREMNRLIDEAFRGFDMPSMLAARPAFAFGAWPRLEATETDKEICVFAELPGLEEKDVEVTVDDGMLTVRGEKKCEIEDKDRQFNERFYGRFERRVPVGTDIDEEKIEAEFKNGVLKITMPKTERARSRARRIAINAPTKH